MGLGKLLTRHHEHDVHERHAGAGFQVIIDNTPINHPHQTYRGAMSIPGAWRAALLISDKLGSVPWHAYRSRTARPTERITPTPPLLDQPSPPDTRMTTISSLALDLVWHGNAIGVIAARDRNGWPTAILPVPADQVGVRRVTDATYSPFPVGAIEYQIGGRGYSTDQLVHIKGPCEPGALRGLGVLEAHLESGTLELAQEQARQARSLSRHGVPTGVLKSANPDLTLTEAADLKRGWLSAQRDRTVAVLNATTEFEALSWNPEELQLIEARKFSLHEIALIFGLPLYFLGADQASRTYSNLEQEGISLIRDTLIGHLARIEQTLSLAFPRGTTVQADLDSVLRADTATRYGAYKVALDGGWLTIDEVRDRENLAPLPTPSPPPAAPGDLSPIPAPRSES